VATGEWEARDVDEVDAVDPEATDEEPEREGRGGTTEGGWSNVAEDGGASRPGVGPSPPGTDL